MKLNHTMMKLRRNGFSLEKKKKKNKLLFHLHLQWLFLNLLLNQFLLQLLYLNHLKKKSKKNHLNLWLMLLYQKQLLQKRIKKKILLL